MITPLKSICFTIATLLITLLLLPACSDDDPPSAGSRVKIKLLNNDCMGTVVAILDDRFTSWGEAGYTINGQTYNGAVWVQQGEALFKDLALDHEYYVDIQSIEYQHLGYCKRAPGPPDKAAAVFEVY